MKRILSILLIGLILLQSSNVSINDILLVNNFFKHAEFHQKNYGDNLLEFLSEHYGDKQQAHRSENHEDPKLPFTDHQNHSDTVLTIHISSIYRIKDKTPTKVSPKYIYKEPVSKVEKLTIFQPPRFA
ncbi:MAG: hypothetical protein QNK20_03520 [Aureibaculum sp.]|nr:hypothetical protein [Aureibaculum sp.]